MLRRIGVLTSLAVVAVMFAGVSSAQAQTAGVCVFTGLSGQLTPGIEDASADDGVIDIERGSYNFTSGGTTPDVPATCAGVFDGTPQVDQVDITSNGFYDNIVCGTGWAHDLDGSGTTVTGLTTGISIGPNEAGYEIPFVAGNGPLLIGGPTATVDASELLPADPGRGSHSTATGLDATHAGVSSSFTGVGFVHITPDSAQGDNCVASTGDAETDAFEVAGFFVAAETG